MIATPAIRPATTLDRARAIDLIREFVIWMHDQGSEVIPSERTVGFYANVFDQYLNGTQEGVVLVAESPTLPTSSGGLVGISMAGHILPFDTLYGKTATGWLTYLLPSTRGHGTGTLLRAALRQALSDRGYRAIAAGYHTWNESSRKFVERRGFRSLQIYGVETLESDQFLADCLASVGG